MSGRSSESMEPSAKRAHPGSGSTDEGLLGSIQSMFLEQQRILTSEIQDTRKALEGRISHIETGQEDLRQDVASLKERVDRVEQMPPQVTAAVAATTPATGTRTTGVLGGFPRDTHRDVIRRALKDLESRLGPQSGIRESYCPFVRSSIGKVRFAHPDNLQDAIAALREEPMTFGEGQAKVELWLAVEKTPDERKRSGLITRAQKALLAAAPDLNDVEVCRASGRLWVGTACVGMHHRPSGTWRWDNDALQHATGGLCTPAALNERMSS